ncbi:MAG: hypothetical protein VR75_07780 [Hyphomonadaceae bacterium BRH_c29]|nr:MAG: hypothetical protein VR75_07780 [Hyphomonadaceae bacterium BRH_c29]
MVVRTKLAGWVCLGLAASLGASAGGPDAPAPGDLVTLNVYGCSHDGMTINVTMGQTSWTAIDATAFTSSGPARLQITRISGDTFEIKESRDYADGSMLAFQSNAQMSERGPRLTSMVTMDLPEGGRLTAASAFSFADLVDQWIAAGDWENTDIDCAD